MKDLLKPAYPAPLVAQVTGATMSDQRNLIARDGLATAAFIPEPRAGHPRIFPLLALYELEGRTRAKSYGLDPELFKAAFDERLRQLGEPQISKGNPGAIVAYWEDELLKAAEPLLVEFTDESGGHYYWMVRYAHQATGRRIDELRVVALKSARQQLAAMMFDIGGWQVMFDITALVKAVDDALARSKT